MTHYRIKRIVEEVFFTDAENREEALENCVDHLGPDRVTIKSETCVKVKEEKP